MVKRFMGRVAKTAPAAGLDAERFEKASTHWMRHTFVRQALVDGAPIEVVSELAGHASIATTSIYSSQELARKIQAIRGMKRRAHGPPGGLTRLRDMSVNAGQDPLPFDGEARYNRQTPTGVNAGQKPRLFADEASGQRSHSGRLRHGARTETVRAHPFRSPACTPLAGMGQSQP